MMMRTSRAKFASSTVLTAGALALAAFLSTETAVAAVSCESLSSLKLADTTITAAEAVAAGAFAPPAPAGGKAGKGGGGNPYANLPAFCRVAATIKPSADSEIKIEIWLPATGWNNKFEAEGNGAWTGSIAQNTLAGGVALGYATSMTDTGHDGGSASFALGHPEKQIDFGYRAVHELAMKSKAIITAYYGQAPKYSYWNGCSAGGKQGLKEAQMYPGDFDGIIAGTPVSDWVGRALGSVWMGQATHATEGSAIPAAKYAAIHKAALDACDALDGVKDGVIENPEACKFDPVVIQCKGEDSNDCLTAAQVETARKVYSGVINPRTKEQIFPGLMPGSEMGWGTQVGANPFGPGLDEFRFIVFKNPDWDYKTLNFDSDVVAAVKADNNMMNAMDPNLKPYFDRGGKILQYHGWADQQMSPGNSPKYYKMVLEKLGGTSKVMDNYRLFMVPGMGHCAGGDGTDTFDKRVALEQWVEQKKAPEQIIASHMANGAATRTRPLCPYPQVAVYKGTGSTDDAANFSCKAK
jgi:feruloyl esterase